MPEAAAKIRRLTPEDIPAATNLSAEAGWNQTSEDWQMLIELGAEGCFAIEVDGKLAATTTLLCYGNRLAWIGMVLTALQYRGRGFARRLLTEALTDADRRKIESVKLDATDQGKPLYEKMGFRLEQAAERWTRPGSNNASQFPAQQDSRMQKWHADSEAFGADRTRLLESLASRNPPLSLAHSYLLIRSGRQAAYLGPCVSESPETAEKLIEAGLKAASSSSWYWDLLPKNTNAVALARDMGFAPQRHLSRMVRGQDLRGNEDAIYAIAGFELG
jgi:GNAT superfamily N-acetyltransferase